MTDYNIAQINVAKMRFDRNSAEMQPFMNGLEPINALAENSPGFVWRLEDESGNATSLVTSLGPDVLVNVSVWKDIESLRAYVYKSAHTNFLRQRSDWFNAPEEAHMALWWVPVDETPSLEHGIARLQYLRMNGPSERAFGFRDDFPKPA